LKRKHQQSTACLLFLPLLLLLHPLPFPIAAMTQVNKEAALTMDDLCPLIDQLSTQLGLAQLALSLLKVKMQVAMGAETQGATGTMEMLMTATKRTGPPLPTVPSTATTVTTTTTPTVPPTSTYSGDWLTVQESTGWSTNTGPKAWMSTSTESWEYLLSLSPTIQLTSSNTFSTYPHSSEPSKCGKRTWKNTPPAKTLWGTVMHSFALD
jgi:hypothetical protein